LMIFCEGIHIKSGSGLQEGEDGVYQQQEHMPQSAEVQKTAGDEDQVEQELHRHCQVVDRKQFQRQAVWASESGRQNTVSVKCQNPYSYGISTGKTQNGRNIKGKNYPGSCPW